MKKKPSDELIRHEIHGLLAVAVGIIPPAEGNLAVPVGKDAVVADGNPVGISPEILENPLWTTERRFAVHNPLFMIELVAEGVECFRFFEVTDSPVEHQSALFEAMFEKVKELAFEQCRHDAYGKEKALPRGYPSASIRRKPTPGDNTVDVGMIHEVLPPGVQNTDGPYFSAEMFRVVGKFHERLGN